MQANGMARRNCYGIPFLKILRSIDDVQENHRYVLIDLRDTNKSKEYICEARNINKDDSGNVIVDLYRVFKSSGKVAKSVFCRLSHEDMQYGKFVVCEEHNSLFKAFGLES